MRLDSFITSGKKRKFCNYGNQSRTSWAKFNQIFKKVKLCANSMLCVHFVQYCMKEGNECINVLPVIICC